MKNSIAALVLLSASSSAFVQVGPTPHRRSTSALQATESFQRSLLGARLGTNGKPSITGSSPEAKQEENERLHRSLLEAKLAYDAIDAALSVKPGSVDVSKPLAVAPVAEPEPATEPIVADIPKPVINKPIVSEEAPVKRTEFTVPRELALVPINESNVQFTAGAIGAATGAILGGPLLAAVGAGACNYLSRKDEETSAKNAVDTASSSVLRAYNWLAQFDQDNKVVESVLSLFGKIVDKAKSPDSPVGDALVTVESTFGGIADKVEEYDLVGGAGTVLNSVGDLVETGVDKMVELNTEYNFSDRVGSVVKGAVDKVEKK